MSMVLDAVGDIVKGAVNVVKDVFSGIGKLFGSGLGAVLLVAAAVFTGGAALGLWSSPFVTGAGVAAEAAGATEAATGLEGIGAAEGGAGAVGEGAAADTLGAAEGAGAAGGTDTAAQLSAQAAETGTADAGAGGGAAGVTTDQAAVAAEAGAPADAAAADAGAATAGTDAGTAAGSPASTMTNADGMTLNTPTSSGGLINGASKGVWDSMGDLGKFAAVNAGAGALKNAFTPSQSELANEQMKRDQEMMQWRQSFLAPNYNVGNIQLGAGSGQVLRDRFGNQVYSTPPAVPGTAGNGLIQTAMR